MAEEIKNEEQVVEAPPAEFMEKTLDYFLSLGLPAQIS